MLHRIRTVALVLLSTMALPVNAAEILKIGAMIQLSGAFAFFYRCSDSRAHRRIGTVGGDVAIDQINDAITARGQSLIVSDD